MGCNISKLILRFIVLILIAALVAGCSQEDKTSDLHTSTEPSATQKDEESENKPAFDANQGTAETEDSHGVSVMFINVGRADSALIQINGLAYLIDAGEKSSVPALFTALAICGVTQLEGVFLTHTHSDHIGGTEALVQKYEVGTLYSAEISEDKKDGENKIEKLAEELSLNHIKLVAGDKVEIKAGVSFNVLGPLEYNEDDDNDNSLVLRLDVNNRTFLFTGDMQFAEEATLLTTGEDLSADVLKVGNHGNPDATSQEFASAVSPEIAVISTDTSKDSDSANENVIAALNGSKVLVTEDYTCGILLTVSNNGEIKISDPQPEKTHSSVEILKIDNNSQTVTLINNGDDADISCYFIFSEKGSEVFVFPEGTLIKAGQRLTLACKGNEGDLIWDDKKVWSAKKEDIGILYDCYGNELSRVS
jgi:competence protein ComEC